MNENKICGGEYVTCDVGPTHLDSVFVLVPLLYRLNSL